MLHTKYQSSMSSSFREEDFQNFAFFSFWLPWQAELWIELNSLNNFCRAWPKEQEHYMQVPTHGYCFLTDKNFTHNFITFLCEIISKSDQWFQKGKISKNFQVSSRLAQWFRRKRCLKKFLAEDEGQTTNDRWLTTDAGHRTITIAHSEYFVLRWAENVIGWYGLMAWRWVEKLAADCNGTDL